MRRIGPYKASTVATFDALVAESTEDRRKLLEPLSVTVAGAVKAYAKATPSLHTLSPIKVSKDEKAALIDGYDGRTAAMKRRLGKMLASLPPENVDLCPYCALDTNPDLEVVECGSDQAEYKVLAKIEGKFRVLAAWQQPHSNLYAVQSPKAECGSREGHHRPSLPLCSPGARRRRFRTQGGP